MAESSVRVHDRRPGTCQANFFFACCSEGSQRRVVLTRTKRLLHFTSSLPRSTCRELWYRASLAWQQILGVEDVRSALVVAHNAVNQALLNTALGLPPTFFRRLTQTNAATSVIDFQPNGDKPPNPVIDRMNQASLILPDHPHATFLLNAECENDIWHRSGVHVEQSACTRHGKAVFSKFGCFAGPRLSVWLCQAGQWSPRFGQGGCRRGLQGGHTPGNSQ